MYRRPIKYFMVFALLFCVVNPVTKAAPPQVWVDDDAQIGYRVTLWKDGDPAQKTIVEGTIDEITMPAR